MTSNRLHIPLVGLFLWAVACDAPVVASIGVVTDTVIGLDRSQLPGIEQAYNQCLQRTGDGVRSGSVSMLVRNCPFCVGEVSDNSTGSDEFAACARRAAERISARATAGGVEDFLLRQTITVVPER